MEVSLCTVSMASNWSDVTFTPAPKSTSRPTSVEDDVLALSHMVVRGFIIRVTKYWMYLTFKLWARQAKTALGMVVLADDHR